MPKKTTQRSLQVPSTVAPPGNAPGRPDAPMNTTQRSQALAASEAAGTSRNSGVEQTFGPSEEPGRSRGPSPMTKTKRKTPTQSPPKKKLAEHVASTGNRRRNAKDTISANGRCPDMDSATDYLPLPTGDGRPSPDPQVIQISPILSETVSTPNSLPNNTPSSKQPNIESERYPPLPTHLSSSSSSSEPSPDPSKARSGQKRQRSHSDSPPASKTPRAATVTTPHNQKYSKLFVDTKDSNTTISFSKFVELLRPNMHSRKIINVTRSKDSSGFILTFKSKEEAEAFLKTPFNNNLDFANIRYTKKPNLRCDVLIHNVNPTISEEEIKQDIENNYDIKLISIYRLTRQIREPTASLNPDNLVQHTRNVPTNTVKVTINQRDLSHFSNHIILFEYNRCRTSRPPPPPIITQCQKCFQFNHATEQCTQRFDTCKLCGGSHALAECSKSMSEKKCINCGEDHLPTYKGCSTYKHTFKIARQQTYKSYADATAQFKRQQTIMKLQTTEAQVHTTTPHHYSLRSPPKAEGRPNIVPAPQSQLRSSAEIAYTHENQERHKNHQRRNTRRETEAHTQPTHQEETTIMHDILDLLNAFKQRPISITAIMTPITNIIRHLLHLFNSQQLDFQASPMCPIL